METFRHKAMASCNYNVRTTMYYNTLQLKFAALTVCCNALVWFSIVYAWFY